MEVQALGLPVGQVPSLGVTQPLCAHCFLLGLMLWGSVALGIQTLTVILYCIYVFNTGHGVPGTTLNILHGLLPVSF